MKFSSAIPIMILFLVCTAQSFAGQEPTPEQLTQDIEHYKLLLQKEPENPRYWNALGFDYYKLDRNAEAEESLTRSIHSDPGYAIAYNNLGVLYLRTKEYPRAEHSFRHALQLDPHYVKAAYNLAVSLFRQKRFRDAYNAYRDAKKIDHAYVQDRFDGSTARDQIKQAIRENPNDEAWKITPENKDER